MFSKTDYDNIISKLNSFSEEKFKKFNESLIPNVHINSVGVRVPILRSMAKEILKQDWQGFLEFSQQETLHEIVMLCGMVTALAKCDYALKLKYTKSFIPRINNWAICDIFCGDIKDTKKHPAQALDFLQPYINSSQEYELRFAVIMLMNYFLTDKYADNTLNIYNSIKHDGYYVKMAVAWGLSVAFIKQREKTLALLKNNNIDDFTFNKAIQKMRESYRISTEDKIMLQKLKRT